MLSYLFFSVLFFSFLFFCLNSFQQHGTKLPQWKRRLTFHPCAEVYCGRLTVDSIWTPVTMEHNRSGETALCTRCAMLLSTCWFITKRKHYKKLVGRHKAGKQLAFSRPLGSLPTHPAPPPITLGSLKAFPEIFWCLAPKPIPRTWYVALSIKSFLIFFAYFQCAGCGARCNARCGGIPIMFQRNLWKIRSSCSLAALPAIPTSKDSRMGKQWSPVFVPEAWFQGQVFFLFSSACWNGSLIWLAVC